MRSIMGALWALFLALAVVACGGGGGGGDGGGSAALSFSPSTVTANVAFGSSATITVRATASNPAIFTGALFVAIADSAGVLAPSVELASIDSRTMSATLHTSPSLPEGRHRGTLQVHLCRDSYCSSEYPGSPVPLPYDLTVTPAPLQAAATTSTAATVSHGGTLARQVTVSVTGPALGWTATSSASWLEIVGGSGTGAGSFQVGYRTPTLAEGDYSATVTVRSTDGQTATVPFTLTVMPTQFVLRSGVPSFSAVNGAPIAAQTLSFALDNDVPATWSATSSAPWMVASPLNGITPAAITLQPDPTRGPLASGAYSSDLVLSSAGIPNRTVTSQLTLTAPTLSAPATALTFGGARGRELSAQSVSVSLNTGANSWPYALSGLPSWLTTSTASGSVGQAGTSVSMAPVAANLTPGSHSATVSVNATVNGDTVTFPLTVNINADQRRLLPSEWGVALASTPSGAVLSRTVTITDNFAGTLAWSASSNAAWLSVTASGSTTGTTSLVMTADPAAVTADQVSYANVTVSSATAGVQPAIIRVAMWKSAGGLTTTATLPRSYSQIVADKIRPYVYAHNRGTSVDVFNAHTGQQVGTITGVAAVAGPMSVSPDGSTLYVLDTAGSSMGVVNLATLTYTETWALGQAVDSSDSVLAVRPNGVDVVFVGSRAYIGGRDLGAQTGVFSPSVASANGQYVFSLGARSSVDYSAMSGGVLFTSFLNGLDSNSGGNLTDVAVSKDGTRVYTASGGGVNVPGRYYCASISASGAFVGALPGGDAYPNNVEVTTDGRVICGINGIYAASDFWVHSASGALIRGFKFAGYARGMRSKQMVVTPDGLVVAALTDDPLLAFVPIGAP